MKEDIRKVFVFGSNEEGLHTGGAALYALKHEGAIIGVGEGMQGNSYGIPTCFCSTTLRGMVSVLPYTKVMGYTINFLVFAEANPNKEFKVTAVGCGIAGFKHKEIAPMFSLAPSNCYFDEVWKPWLGEEHKYWGTYE